MKSAAISAAFSLVTALGEFCSPPSKTYSSVPPSLAAPRYRNNSTENAGVASRMGDQNRCAVAHSLLPPSSAIPRGKVNLLKRVWEKPVQRGETHSAESDKN